MHVMRHSSLESSCSIMQLITANDVQIPTSQIQIHFRAHLCNWLGGLLRVSCHMSVYNAGQKKRNSDP